MGGRRYAREHPRRTSIRAARTTYTVILDDETRVLVETMARRAGLELPPTLQLALLLETAPCGLELVRRIRRDLPWSAGPAAPFKLPFSFDRDAVRRSGRTD
jgi:hypothetical protein